MGEADLVEAEQHSPEPESDKGSPSPFAQASLCLRREGGLFVFSFPLSSFLIESREEQEGEVRPFLWVHKGSRYCTLYGAGHTLRQSEATPSGGGSGCHKKAATICLF